MAAVLASTSYCRHYFEPSDQGRLRDDLSFGSSISNLRIPNLETNCRHSRGHNEIIRSVAESEKIGSNGQPIKMVPTKELIRSVKGIPHQKLESVNGSKVIVNGTSLVKRNGTSALAKPQKKPAFDNLSATEELKVLPSDEDFSWARDDYNSWTRTADIWSFVLTLRLRILFDNAKWAYPGGFTEDKQKLRMKKTASWLREQVLQLGPTFIKLGQLSSTRSDLFPREFVDELVKLQDRVPAFSPEKARAFIQKELGAPVDILFKEFEDQPIAAASLGQVHRAILHNGEKVAVKVQRPGLKKLFDIDLRNLKLLAEYFQRSETFGGPTRDWIGIYDECSKILYEEIDYINEGKNADRFRRDYRNIKWVRIPLIYWDYTSTKVLTLEYVPGIKINNLDQLDAQGNSRSQIASRAIESYLIQVLSCLIDLKALQPTGDLSSVRRSVKFFLNNLLNQTPDQEQTLAAIGEDLFSIAIDQPFTFPTTFTFVIRAFSTLEGISYTLNPGFSFVKTAAPYAQELLDLKQKPPGGTELVQEIRRQANDARNSTISMPYRVQRIEEFVKELESGDLKLRVRVLESERAARKASIMQMASMYTALGGALLNVGITLNSQGSEVIANGSFIGAGVFLTLLIRSMQRVKKLDKFEKMI